MRMSTAVMGMPLKATEKAALAATPAASTFQRWRGDNGVEEGDWVMLQRSVRRCKGFENQKIMSGSS
ncbi:hypothetical protein VCH24_52350 [Variovorax boronicumulans]|nr:hypothetical protein VCH24_52350 [Variovorax boronicumulans]